MLIKTVVDNVCGREKPYKSYCKANETKDFKEIELNIAEIEYDDTFVEEISRKILAYYIHTVFTYDYESSSDAGDGRDDYYTEEDDAEVTLSECIIKNNEFYGVMCECFGKQSFLLLDYPETIISHPGNYGGKNYHFYRDKRFNLVKK